MGDFGVKISKDDTDVNTATKENLFMSSKYPMFKISIQGPASVTMAQTTLNGAITSSGTSITLTSAASFPSSHTSGQTPYIFIYDAVSGFWEAISYTGKSGNLLTGVTRGYLGTSALSHANGSSVIQGYAETVITHSKGYPPVHFVQRNDGAGYNYMIPASIGEFGEFNYDASVSSTNLIISFFLGQYAEFYDATLATVIAGTYGFRYTIMEDSITTPYY